MCQSTIQSARIFLLAATLRIYKQSQYREQEKPVLLVNSCVILRMEIIPPPTQISITYHPGHIYCPLTVLLQALSPSQALLRPHSNHILHCLSLGDPGTGVSPSPVKWSWPNITFIKSFRRPWPPTQNKQSVSKDYVKFELFSFPWPLLTTGSHRDLCGYGRPPGIQQW